MNVTVVFINCKIYPQIVNIHVFKQCSLSLSAFSTKAVVIEKMVHLFLIQDDLMDKAKFLA